MSETRKKTITITVWHARKLYDQLEAVLLRRADDHIFTLLKTKDAIAPQTDLLLDTKKHPCYSSHFHAVFPYAIVTLKAQKASDTLYLNYLLDELLFHQRYYGQVLATDQKQELDVGDIHTMTLSEGRLLLHCQHGSFSLSDEQAIAGLTNCPAFIPTGDGFFISHRYACYPASQRPHVLWKSYDEHQAAVQRYFEEQRKQHKKR